MADDVGYRHCACRDCFEITIGHTGELCSCCEDAGCSTEAECCCEPDEPAEP